MKRPPVARALALGILLSAALVAVSAEWFAGAEGARASLSSRLAQADTAALVAWWMLATRSAVLVVASASLIGLVAGTGLGAAAVYGGRGPAAALSRLIEFIGAVPGLILVGILRVADPSGGFFSLIGALALLRTLEVAQLVRAQVLTLLPSDFVEAARALGASRRWQLRVHILPRLVQPVLVNTLLGASTLIGLQAALDFVGLGLPSAVPSWGGGLSVLATQGAGSALGAVVVSIGALSAAFYGLGTSLAGSPPAAFAEASLWSPWRRRGATLNEPR